MNHRIQLADQGTEFLTRRQGRVIREKLAQKFHEMPAGDLIIVDMVQVGAMAPSFADEAFGKLLVDLGSEAFHSRVRIVNLNELNQVLLDAVFATRRRGRQPNAKISADKTHS